MSKLTPVILCGGNGTRLWPLSREHYPKQFLSLANDGQSMLQNTALRLAGVNPDIAQTCPVLVCNADHRFLAAQQLQEQGIAGAKLVLEPAGRNTAPALTLAALVAEPSAVLLAMPADHVMTRPEQLHRAVEAAWPLASEGAMVTFGIVANRPETGYGYIQKGVEERNGSFRIQSFAEKPTLELAEQYLRSGDYLWNSGLFMVRADQWLKAMGALQPEMLRACEQAMAQSSQDMDFIRPDSELFGACPADSIDYAVMEKLPVRPELGVPARVVPLDAGWSDLGAWDALWDVLPRDAQGNAGSGETLAIDTRNSLLFSESRLIAAVGLDNVVVVETPDAVLVVDKSRNPRREEGGG